MLQFAISVYLECLIYLVGSQVVAALPSPITGNELMRKRAAPIGINSISSAGSVDFTGLGCSSPARPYWSIVHCGMRFPFALITIGAASTVNG